MRSFAAVFCLSLSVLAACSPKSSDGPAVTSASAAASPDVKFGDLVLRDYAMRAPLGNLDNTAVYLTITNSGATDDRLLSVACVCAEVAKTHTMIHENGMMTMAEAKDGFTIPAGQTLTLSPGGNHIMLERLNSRPAAGGTQELTFIFEKAGTVTVALPVLAQIAATSSQTGAHGHH